MYHAPKSAWWLPNTNLQCYRPIAFQSVPSPKALSQSGTTNAHATSAIIATRAAAATTAATTAASNPVVAAPSGDATTGQSGMNQMAR